MHEHRHRFDGREVVCGESALPVFGQNSVFDGCISPQCGQIAVGATDIPVIGQNAAWSGCSLPQCGQIIGCS